MMRVIVEEWTMYTRLLFLFSTVMEIVCEDFPSRYTQGLVPVPMDRSTRAQCCAKFPSATSDSNPLGLNIYDRDAILGYWEKFPCPPPWTKERLLERVNWSCIGPYWRDVKFDMAKRCNIDLPGANLVSQSVLSMTCGHSCRLVIVCICCTAVGVAVIVLACILYRLKKTGAVQFDFWKLFRRRQPEIYTVTGSPTHQTALNTAVNKYYSEHVEQETKLQTDDRALSMFQHPPPCGEHMSRSMCRSRDSLGMLHNHYASEDSMRAAQGGPYSSREDNRMYRKQRPSTPDVFLHVSPSRSSYEKLSEEETPSPCSTEDPPIYEYIDNDVYPPRVIAPGPRRTNHSRTWHPPREIISAYEIPVIRGRGHTEGGHRSHSHAGVLVLPPPPPPPPPITMAESWTQTQRNAEMFDLEEPDRHQQHVRPPHRTRRGKRRRQTSSSLSETESDTTSSSLNQ